MRPYRKVKSLSLLHASSRSSARARSLCKGLCCLYRLCWSFVTKTSWWDLLQRLKRLPADSASLPGVLARMDRALHCERYTPRPAFSLLLSALKLQLLTGSEDPIAQIVCQVILSRLETTCILTECMAALQAD